VKSRVCLSSRIAPPISKAKIAIDVEKIQSDRRMSTQLHLRLGVVILSQRQSMGLVVRIEVGNMAKVEGGFLKHKAHRSSQGS
jgi:hypothetical protein